MKRRWIRLAVLAGVLAMLAVVTVAAQAWWERHELGLARAEIERGDFVSALSRLETLAATRPRWAGADQGELDYWLGSCHWGVGRRMRRWRHSPACPREESSARSPRRSRRTGCLNRGIGGSRGTAGRARAGPRRTGPERSPQ